MRSNLLGIVIGSLLSVGVINAAAAADLLVKAPVYAPPVPYNWSGLYLGANVGGAWSNRSIAGTALGDPFSTALIGGFQLGYNLQAGHFLAGVEGDFDWATFGHPKAPFSDQQKWISTFAARFGFASGRWLAYGKVGGGWAQDNVGLDVPHGTNWTTNTNGGWLFGGGLEYGFKPHLTVKLEYDFLNLGDGTTSTVPAVSWRRDTQMIKLGMNYKFQPGASNAATQTPDDPDGSSRAGQSAEELAKQSNNPFASMVVVPFRNDTLPNDGPFHGTQNVLGAKPIVPFSVNEDWNVITRTEIPLVSQPDPQTDTSINGLGDITENLYFSPVHSGIKDFHWGFGPAITVPTASDAILGSGKVSLGPALAVFYDPQNWEAGLIIKNQWSVAGAPGRDRVNELTVEVISNYVISGGEGWHLDTHPVATANWTAKPGQQWTVPVGGGLGHLSKLGDQAIDWSVQGYYNVVRPDNVPAWELSVFLTFLLL